MAYLKPSQTVLRANLNQISGHLTNVFNGHSKYIPLN